MKKLVKEILDRRVIRYTPNMTRMYVKLTVLYDDGTTGYQYIEEELPKTVYEMEENNV